MALDYIVDSVEGLDDSVRSLYVEKDGKFQLEVSGIDTGEELKGALQKEREANKDAQRRLKELQGRESEAARKAAEEAAAKGDFEQLYKSAQAELEKVAGERDAIRTERANDARKTAAIKIASELAEGTNVELLSTFIEPRLKYTDEGLKVLDDAGQLTVSSLEDLGREISSNARFGSLLKGNQSSGGGATGSGDSGGAGAGSITRNEFDNLTPDAQMKHIKSGGNVVD